MPQKKEPEKPTEKKPPAVRWHVFDLQWNFLTKLCGSVPADPNLIEPWLDSRKPTVKPAGGREIFEIHEEVFQTLAAEAAASEDTQEPPHLLIFQRDNGHLVQRFGTIKAHIKDCSRQISGLYVDKIRGQTSFAVRATNGIYYDPAQKWVPILRPDGTPVTEPDGIKEKAIHVWSPRGPTNALKAFEFIEPAMMRFQLWVLGKSISEADLDTLFTYGGVHGYAGERGDGEGKYTFSLSRAAGPEPSLRITA